MREGATEMQFKMGPALVQFRGWYALRLHGAVGKAHAFCKLELALCRLANHDARRGKSSACHRCAHPWSLESYRVHPICRIVEVEKSFKESPTAKSMLAGSGGASRSRSRRCLPYDRPARKSQTNALHSRMAHISGALVTALAMAVLLCCEHATA